MNTARNLALSELPFTASCAGEQTGGPQQVRLSQRDFAATLGISQDRVRKSLFDCVRLGLIQMDVPVRPGPA